MESARYRKRIADQLLKERLEAKGAVLIRGPKWCGKTSTAEQHCRSVLYMSNPLTREANISMAKVDPEYLLEGEDDPFYI